MADGLNDKTFDVTNTGVHLDAVEYNKLADEENSIVVDMRNHYESEIGHFKNAITPDVDTFRGSLDIIEEDLKDHKEDKNLIMYCTGGIRCEKASAYFKYKGFKNVYQLKGGIIEYTKQVNKEKLKNNFIGKNFVFDSRLSERITDDVISNCHQCGKKCDNHINCKNVNCNLLFLQCLECKVKYKSCCSIECIEISQLSDTKRKELRKGKTNKNIFHSHKKVKLNIKKIIA